METRTVRARATLCICIYPHVPSSGRKHVASARDIRLHTGCPIGRGSRKYVRRQKVGPPVNTRDPTFARIFGLLCHENGATRRLARRGDATRPFDVELALHGGRDNVARVHSPSPWLSRRVSLFRVWTRDERIAIRETQITTMPLWNCGQYKLSYLYNI